MFRGSWGHRSGVLYGDRSEGQGQTHLRGEWYPTAETGMSRSVIGVPCVCVWVWELAGESQKHSGLAVRVEEDKGREEQAILHLSAVNARSWDH